MMKLFWIVAIVACAFLCLPATARTWTSADGRRIEAELVGIDGNRVKLKRVKDNKIVETSIDSFAKDDQAFLLRKRRELDLAKAREAARVRAAEYRKKKAEEEKQAAREERRRKASEINVRDAQGLVAEGEPPRGLEQEMTVKETIGLVILILGGIIVGVGALMMLVEGFRCGFIWGIISAVPGVGWILFALTHWSVSQKPLLFQVIGIAVAIFGGWLAKFI